jgi:mannose-1-phosphate guanylyltransferase
MFGEDIRRPGKLITQPRPLDEKETRGQCKDKHRWGVVLAGGEGLRLRSLARFVSADDKPKQFCTFFGGRSLLSHTRHRIERCISPHQTLFVLLRSHESFYTRELENVSSDRMIVQPCNRGTLPAILYSLLRVVEFDPRAVVAFFPSDHHYSDEENFRAGADMAFEAAERNPDCVVLLGAPAKHAATDYGWIEAEACISPHRYGLLRVKRFWEKPTLKIAEDLLDRGCIWNTFVMVGRASAFLNLIESGAPEVFEAFRTVWDKAWPKDQASIMQMLYENLPTVDLSKSISAVPESLGVFCLGDVGWSDVGDPRRLLEVLAHSGEGNAWVTAWRKETMHAASNGNHNRGERMSCVASTSA